MLQQGTFAKLMANQVNNNQRKSLTKIAIGTWQVTKKEKSN
jgi:hypothetical protein